MKRKHRLFIVTGGLLLLCLLCIGFYVIRITSVTYIGNTRYTEEELTELLFDKPYSLNPIYCFWESNYGEKKQIPFIQSYDINFQSWNTIQIQIYEKSIVGYVDYKGYRMYFDKDGIIVESSQEALENVIKIEGLYFSHMILHQKLPIEEEKIFNLILSLTQMLIKYALPVDKVYFDSDYNITIYLDKLRFEIGQDIYLNEKIAKVNDLLPSVMGLSGEINMKEFTEDTEEFRLKKDKE